MILLWGVLSLVPGAQKLFFLLVPVLEQSPGRAEPAAPHALHLLDGAKGWGTWWDSLA